MTTGGREIVRLELKYCEECGGLWLRIENTSGSYCASCEQRLDKLPDRAEDNRLRGGTGPMRRATKSTGPSGLSGSQTLGTDEKRPA
jgi:hypothetical protein